MTLTTKPFSHTDETLSPCLLELQAQLPTALRVNSQKYAGMTAYYYRILNAFEEKFDMTPGHEGRTDQEQACLMAKSLIAGKVQPPLRKQITY